MGKLREDIEKKLRVYMVPQADGGNREDAYTHLKEFCDNMNEEWSPENKESGPCTPESIIATHILKDVEAALARRRKARRS